MSMMVSFVLSFFPRDVLDEILNLIESVSEDSPSYSLYIACDDRNDFFTSDAVKTSKTPRGKKDSTKRHHHRHHKRQPGEQQFPIQVVTG